MLTVQTRGLREVQRALARLPAAAAQELLVGQRKLASVFGAKISAAGRADSRQSARAAGTVRVVSDAGGIGVRAGPHPLLFGSEFGSNSRWGWYSARRFRNSTGRQFRPHRGGASYWFFRTVEENSGAVEREAATIGDRVIGRWSA